MRTFCVLCAAIILTFTAANGIFAQDNARPIDYGETLTGNLTEQRFEVPYTFEGIRDELIIIEMRPTSSALGGATPVPNTISSPTIVLLDSDYNVLMSAASSMSSSAVLITKLPYDGTYIILATRYNGRLGYGAGYFDLSLLKPQVLEFDTPVQGEIRGYQRGYYVVDTQEPFRVFYERLDGSVRPRIMINRSDGSRLTSLGMLIGDGLTSGALQVEPTSQVIAEFYIVTVDFNICCPDDDDFAEYSLTLLAD